MEVPKIRPEFVREFIAVLNLVNKTMPVTTSTTRLEARISTERHSILKRADELRGAP
jgi:hypothetical protein